MSKKRGKRATKGKSAPKTPTQQGELWILPHLSSQLLMPGGTPKSTERPLLVLENTERLNNPSITRVLIAPISTSPLIDELDYIISPGQHDHCQLTKESAVVVSCIQPIAKSEFEGGQYRGYLSQDGMLAILDNLCELFGMDGYEDD